MINIVSWNVNSINSRLLHIEKLIATHNPSIILLQEIKCITERFPYVQLEDLGYNIAVLGQKSYNGVAILSKSSITDIIEHLPNLEDESFEARYIEASTQIDEVYLRVASVYVPNGREVDSQYFVRKLNFLQCLQQHLLQRQKYDENLVIGGDFNVAPENIDVYNPIALNNTIGFNIQERALLRSILNQGFFDSFRIANPGKQEFSWWDYRSSGIQHNKGMRIDHILLSPQSSDLLIESGIYRDIRLLEKPSDHAPIYAKFLSK